MAKEKPCGVPWAVCPDCIGAGLTQSAGIAWCERCMRRWPIKDVEPCPWPATRDLWDGEQRGRVCASHAAHPSANRIQPGPKPVNP